MKKMKTVEKEKIKVKDIPDFDFGKHLDSSERIAAYLDSVLQDNDMDLLMAALGDIARARGMSYVAQQSDVSREALYRVLRENKKPRFETISKVCAALGLRLSVAPAFNGHMSTIAAQGQA